jgi:hypothetical protein
MNESPAARPTVDTRQGGNGSEKGVTHTGKSDGKEDASLSIPFMIVVVFMLPGV